MVVPKPSEERTSFFRRTIESQIMVFLAGHVIETRYLKDLSTGPSSDLRGATIRAIYYSSQWAMGPTKLVVPMSAGELPPGPFLVAAHELLDQLYAETERLVLQKMTAVHYLARALIERDELIGDELEEVFLEAEAVDPTLTRPFERKLLQFRAFMPPPPAREAQNEWQPAGWRLPRRRPRRRSCRSRVPGPRRRVAGSARGLVRRSEHPLDAAGDAGGDVVPFGEPPTATGPGPCRAPRPGACSVGTRL